MSSFKKIKEKQRVILANYDDTHKSRFSYLLSKPKELELISDEAEKKELWEERWAYKELLYSHFYVRNSEDFVKLYKQYLNYEITFEDLYTSINKFRRLYEKLSFSVTSTEILLINFHPKCLDFYSPISDLCAVGECYMRGDYSGLEFYGLTSSKLPEENVYTYVKKLSYPHLTRVLKE